MLFDVAFTVISYNCFGIIALLVSHIPLEDMLVHNHRVPQLFKPLEMTF